jgi:hypothetical protein
MIHAVKSNNNIFISWTAKKGKAWVCCRWLAGIVGSYTAGGLDVFILNVLCYQTDRGLWVGLITCPENAYRLWCV